MWVCLAISLLLFFCSFFYNIFVSNIAQHPILPSHVFHFGVFPFYVVCFRQMCAPVLKLFSHTMTMSMVELFLFVVFWLLALHFLALSARDFTFQLLAHWHRRHHYCHSTFFSFFFCLCVSHFHSGCLIFLFVIRSFRVDFAFLP